LTRWAIETLQTQGNLALQPFLDLAMTRQYSGSPYEDFFTGGGVHRFENFDKDDNDRVFSLHEAFRNSTNLVFIRLMRDLVAYHRARLAYDADDVLGNPAHPERQKMLEQIAEEESRQPLRRAYQNYANQKPAEIVRRVVGKGNAERRLTILFFAWSIGKTESELQNWLQQNKADVADAEVSKLYRAYHNPRLTLADHAYLLSIHPLDLWSAGELRRQPTLGWEKLYHASSKARSVSSAWLLESRNRRAQDLRLRIRIEKDAFIRMSPYWQRLGFPFKTMVPTYATAIGSSSDRPVALAELVGILVNDGVRRPSTSLTRVHFAEATPYETVLEREMESGQQVLAPEVARTVRRAMANVVEQGTARRLNGVFKLPNGKTITVGGKTGSGDNRFETFSRSGAVISSRATNRTATFVFYIGERYFGVITAYVEGREAERYRFTSGLPVSILKLLAPTLLARLEAPEPAPATLAARPPIRAAGAADHP
jgi:membrane peptidoglycan carboxypeptidase